MATAKTQTIKIQIDDLVREATAEEIAEIEAQQAANDFSIPARIAARESANAKLAELGLTQEEIAAL